MPELQEEPQIPHRSRFGNQVMHRMPRQFNGVDMQFRFGVGVGLVGKVSHRATAPGVRKAASSGLADRRV
jgi:hypothetical protein